MVNAFSRTCKICYGDFPERCTLFFCNTRMHPICGPCAREYSETTNLITNDNRLQCFECRDSPQVIDHYLERRYQNEAIQFAVGRTQTWNTIVQLSAQLGTPIPTLAPRPDPTPDDHQPRPEDIFGEDSNDDDDEAPPPAPPAPPAPQAPPAPPAPQAPLPLPDPRAFDPQPQQPPAPPQPEYAPAGPGSPAGRRRAQAPPVGQPPARRRRARFLGNYRGQDAVNLPWSVIPHDD